MIQNSLEPPGDAVSASPHDRTGPDGRIRVAILGSTGSIGVSALRVIERHPEQFDVSVLAANRSVDALALQARQYDPQQVVICDENAYDGSGASSGWTVGREALIDSVTRGDVDVVINALVGFAGLEPSLATLAAGKRLALANKESLVAGGELMTRALRESSGELVPIDSEHSAVMQCLASCPTSSVQRVVLTASGGPFRGWEEEQLERVRPGDALQHPTWDMGAKITIDSATLANKALEVIEAHFLYGIPYDRIEAVVHPQSVVHSLVEFVDGSVMAQLGFPTMELPILYALTYPHRLDDSELRTFDPVKSSPLTFEPIDLETFPLFRIGTEAGRSGGIAPVAFNAANEVAVESFLSQEVPFQAIAEIVGESVGRMGAKSVTKLGDVLEADRETREVAHELVRHMQTTVKGYNR